MITHRYLRLFGLIEGINPGGDPKRGDEIDLYIYEAEPDEQVIGSVLLTNVGSNETSGGFWRLDELHLPPAAFAELWTASAVADGAVRDLSIIAEEADDPAMFTITQSFLQEYMPEAFDPNPNKSKPILRHVHPVVAELRNMQERLSGSLYWLFVLFYVFLGVYVVGLVLAFIKWLWKALLP
jgi:hypothetical protein